MVQRNQNQNQKYQLLQILKKIEIMIEILVKKGEEEALHQVVVVPVVLIVVVIVIVQITERGKIVVKGRKNLQTNLKIVLVLILLKIEIMSKIQVTLEQMPPISNQWDWIWG